MDSKTNITKETKNKIRVDYEGKLSFKERMLNKLKSSQTWIKGVVTFFRFMLMLGVSFVILYPFFARIAGSFMSKEDVIDATVSLIPKNFTFEIYKYIIIENHYFEALLNTALLSLFCALLQTLVACLIGYGLAKFKFKGNKLLMGAVVVSMIIPHRTLKLAIVQHFTKFDILKVISWNYKGPIELIKGAPLDLSNTFAPLIILSIFGLAFKNGLYIYLMRQFFKGVPDELEESAYVDGSGVFRTFFKIILPLSVPMMITVFLFSFSWQWTDQFYTGLFFTSTINKVYLMPDIYQVMPPSLQTTYAGATLYNNVVQNTAGILIILPLVIIYLFCQRYLVQGIERSGLVG
jgi:multiple sugar transport system permease protein